MNDSEATRINQPDNSRFNQNTPDDYTDNEETQFAPDGSNSQSPRPDDFVPADEAPRTPGQTNPQAVRKSNMGARTGAAMAGGVVIGALGMMAMSMTKGDKNEDPVSKPETNNEHPWADEHIRVATGVNDDMSFNQAFAAARAEVGPGGAFEWHGRIYGTYYGDEWNAMTPEQRAEYSSHFDWSKVDASSGNVHQSGNHHAQNTGHDNHHDTGSDNHQANNDNTKPHKAADDDDDIEIISVNKDDPQAAQTETGSSGEDILVTDIETPGDHEVEIIGVVHDPESGANVGAVTIDNQDVLLIDVDNDLTFDFLAVDANQNQQLDDDEIVNIQNQHLTVNDLGGFTDPSAGMMATDSSEDIVIDPGYDA